MFKRKKRNNEFDSYEDDIMNIVTKEEEIMSSYVENYEPTEEYEIENIEEEETEVYETFDESNEEIDSTEVEDDQEETYEEFDSDYSDEEYENYMEDELEYNQDRERKFKKIINIVFSIVMIILIMITVDVISVARYDVGPFFAIPIQKYKDGGSKAYYGFGYKVIKYKQLQGRRDKELGFWNLKYNIEPLTIEGIDLAIEMQGNEVKTYKKYYKEFVRITATLEKVNKKDNKITVSYKDEGEKYSLDMICTMASKKSVLDKFETGKEITFIGTVTDFKAKTKNTHNTLYIDNCFAEQ